MRKIDLKKKMHIFSHSRIQKQMFAAYAGLLLCVLLVVSLWASVSFNYLVNKFSGEAVYQIATKLNTDVDALIEKMDIVAKQIVFSNEISEEFLHRDGSWGGLFLPLEKRRSISNELYSILGPSLSSVAQINLIDCQTGNYIGVGMHPQETLVAVSELHEAGWIDQTIALDGLRNIVSPHDDQWGKDLNRQVFSVARAIFDPLDHNRSGVVEVPCDMDTLYQMAEEYLAETDYIEKVYLYGNDGTLLYASHPEEMDYLQFTGKGGYQADKERNEIIACHVSDLTGCTVVMAADRLAVSMPVYRIYINFLAVAACAMAAVLLISFYLSRKFTKPVQAIYQAAKEVSFVQSQADLMERAEQYGNEFEDFQVFFERLCERLDDAVQEAVLARTYEMEARRKALEAQINPHFLYNTFAVIQSYADDANIQEISDICDDVSRILRYAISEKGDCTVGSEIDICGRYMELMFRRNYDRLSYSIHIDERMVDFPMPRMILQPLVENVFKHALMMTEQWRVEIEGCCEEDCWYIHVKDNGTGFDERLISQIYGAISAAKLSNESVDSSTTGIGLVNIAVRMKLKFAENTIFRIENRKDGGCMITIGVKGGAADGGSKNLQSFGGGGRDSSAGESYEED